jgi:hypothetical protein
MTSTRLIRMISKRVSSRARSSFRCVILLYSVRCPYWSLQGFKAVFTSPSSAKVIEGDGDGADIIENNRRARRTLSGVKVKKHVAQIIQMKKVTPRSIAYIACQVSHNFLVITIINNNHTGRFDLRFLR